MNTLLGQTITWKNKLSKNTHVAEVILYYQVKNTNTGTTYYIPITQVNEMIKSGKVEVLDSNNESIKLLYGSKL